MFRRNESYKQQDLFGIEQGLTKAQIKMWNDSKEHKFYESFFSVIDEDAFRVLYSEKKSRPNAPVNQLVGSLILKHLNDWTYEELFKNLSFNMLTRHAIGIHNSRQDVFSPASLYNFQNRVIQYLNETGEDLFMKVFDNLTAHQIKTLGIATDIQRGDSFLMGSNIFNSTRMGLLIEVLQRINRILKEDDRMNLSDLFQYYMKHKSNYYCYRLKKEDLQKEMKNIAQVFLEVNTLLSTKGYQGVKEVAIFERVFSEHFIANTSEVSIIPSNELNSGILSSPDDEEATYRKKRQVQSKGFSGHLSETANPENEIQLITDCAVVKNNVDDSTILEARLPKMIEKTPELNEYHADSAYTNERIDLIMKEYEIVQIQSTVRGRKSFAGIEIEIRKNGNIMVSCNGGQSVRAFKKNKMWRADFQYKICEDCHLRDVCNTRIYGVKKGAPKRTLFFEDKKILTHLRLKNINNIPETRRKLRANVEATVKDAKRGMKNNKLRVRGMIKAKYYLIWTAIAINLGRITRYSNQKVSYSNNWTLSTVISKLIQQKETKLNLYQ